jgi:lipopolysaccharide transport protein LptA
MKTLCILTAVIISFAALAAEKKEPVDTINIKAEKIEVMRNENCVVLQDNIKVTTTEYQLSADKAVLYQADGSEEYNKIVATGNIRLVSPEHTVTGQKAVWEKKSNEITITGSPRVRQKDGGVASAAVIRYNTVTKKLTFQGKKGTGRSRIVISEGMMKKMDKNKDIKLIE